MSRTIALIGISGAGKSKIGRTLAARLGVDLLDVDAEVERRQGRTIADIFATDGEAAFRAAESDVCVEASDAPGRSSPWAGERR